MFCCCFSFTLISVKIRLKVCDILWFQMASITYYDDSFLSLTLTQCLSVFFES